MKKAAFGSLLFLLATTAATAQQQPAPARAQAQAADAPPGIGVVKIGWRFIREHRDWDVSSESAANHTLDDPRAAPPRSNNSTSPRTSEPAGSNTQPREAGMILVAGGNQSTGVSPQTGIKSRTPMPRGDGSGVYNYEARIRNEGGLRIEALDWHYQFLDPATGREMGRHTFQSFRRVKPGQEATLAHQSVSQPARLISASTASGKGRVRFDERVSVLCVAYSDGTFAPRAAGDADDCDDLRAALKARRKR